MEMKWGHVLIIPAHELGRRRPLYILSSSSRAPGLLRSPLLFGKPVPKQTGQTSLPRPVCKQKPTKSNRGYQPKPNYIKKKRCERERERQTVTVWTFCELIYIFGSFSV